MSIQSISCFISEGNFEAESSRVSWQLSWLPAESAAAPSRPAFTQLPRGLPRPGRNVNLIFFVWHDCNPWA